MRDAPFNMTAVLLASMLVSIIAGVIIGGIFASIGFGGFLGGLILCIIVGFVGRFFGPRIAGMVMKQSEVVDDRKGPAMPFPTAVIIIGVVALLVSAFFMLIAGAPVNVFSGGIMGLTSSVLIMLFVSFKLMKS